MSPAVNLPPPHFSSHAGLVPGNPRHPNTDPELPTKFEPPMTAVSQSPPAPRQTHFIAPQQQRTEFQPGSSGLVLANLCSNGHVVFTYSTQNRMTFPGIPPTALFDGVGGKVLTRWLARDRQRQCRLPSALGT